MKERTCSLLTGLGDAFAEVVDIYPSGKIHAGLGTIKTGADLTTAVGQDGKPLLAGSVTTDVANGVAANVATLHSSASFPPSAAGNTFVALREASPAPQASVISCEDSLFLKRIMEDPDSICATCCVDISEGKFSIDPCQQ
jgi:hypothetical protein